MAKKTHSPQRSERVLDQSCLKSLAGYQLRRADIAMRQAFAEHIAETFDVRPVEFSVLVLLAANAEVTHKQLSHALDVAPSNMVQVVAGLEKRRLLKRRQNPDDGRSMFLLLTATGRRLEERVRRAVTVMENDLLAPWPSGERERLLEMLRALRDTD